MMARVSWGPAAPASCVDGAAVDEAAFGGASVLAPRSFETHFPRGWRDFRMLFQYFYFTTQAPEICGVVRCWEPRTFSFPGQRCVCYKETQ